MINVYLQYVLHHLLVPWNNVKTIYGAATNYYFSKYEPLPRDTQLSKTIVKHSDWTIILMK